MIFESNEFTFTKANYQRARREVLNKINEYFHTKINRLPWGALELCGLSLDKLGEPLWVPISDMSKDTHAVGCFQLYKVRSKKLLLKSRSNKN